jgi:hypothetical protein
MKQLPPWNETVATGNEVVARMKKKVFHFIHGS